MIIFHLFSITSTNSPIIFIELFSHHMNILIIFRQKQHVFFPILENIPIFFPNISVINRFPTIFLSMGEKSQQSLYHYFLSQQYFIIVFPPYQYFIYFPTFFFLSQQKFPPAGPQVSPAGWRAGRWRLGWSSLRPRSFGWWTAAAMACCWAQRTLEKWWIFPGFLVSTREKMGGLLKERNWKLCEGNGGKCDGFWVFTKENMALRLMKWRQLWVHRQLEAQWLTGSSMI